MPTDFSKTIMNILIIWLCLQTYRHTSICTASPSSEVNHAPRAFVYLNFITGSPLLVESIDLSNQPCYTSEWGILEDDECQQDPSFGLFSLPLLYMLPVDWIYTESSSVIVIYSGHMWWHISDRSALNKSETKWIEWKGMCNYLPCKFIMWLHGGTFHTHPNRK